MNRCIPAEAEPADSSDATHQSVPSRFLTQNPLGLNDVIPELEARVSAARAAASSSEI